MISPSLYTIPSAEPSLEEIEREAVQALGRHLLDCVDGCDRDGNRCPIGESLLDVATAASDAASDARREVA